MKVNKDLVQMLLNIVIALVAFVGGVVLWDIKIRDMGIWNWIFGYLCFLISFKVNIEL